MIEPEDWANDGGRSNKRRGWSSLSRVAMKVTSQAPEATPPQTDNETLHAIVSRPLAGRFIYKTSVILVM